MWGQFDQLPLKPYHLAKKITSPSLFQIVNG